MSKFPTSLSFPIQKVKEMIAEIENDRNNPKASTNKTIQKRMSKNAHELSRSAKAITDIIKEQKPYAKKYAKLRGDCSEQQTQNK